MEDKRPDWLRKHTVGFGEVEYKGKIIPYTIAKKELEPRLPGFLGYPNGEHLFISEEVPENFRIPQLIHEIVEFTEFKGQSNRCLNSLIEEFNFVSIEIRKNYIEYRKNFFGMLVKYYEDSEDEEFKSEILASYEFLKIMQPICSSS